jgi:hypothetical protein
MKKIQISIPTPCHENWNAMTPQDKGRFCGSCQKTVIDFSNMNDRQIAEFFKKPAGSVCGRFHTDQLDRDIQVPKKRIPWVKYFFSVTWPAFVLFLKSCGPKLEVQGKPFVVDNSANAKPKQDSLYTTIGLMLPQITPEDSLEKQIPSPIIEDSLGLIKGDVSSEEVMGDSIALPVRAVPDTNFVKECERPMDTVNIIGYGTHLMGRLIAGGISVIRTDKSHPETPAEKPIEKEGPAFLAYPNPVRVGSQLTIKSLQEDMFRQIHLISATGQLISLTQTSNSKVGNGTIVIPSNISSGTYFVRIVTAGNKTKTIKVVIVN